MTYESTDKLTSAMAAGNEAAVEAFYRRYFDWLYARARHITRRDESFCLDVVQDSVLRIVRTIRRVDDEPQLLGWMQLVVRTTALDHLRSERRRQVREATLVAIRGEGCSDVSGPSEDDEDANVRLEWLSKSISGFDAQLVRMIELRYTRRWTLSRIAESLGLTIGTVDGRLRRAIHDLRLRAAEAFDD